MPPPVETPAFWCGFVTGDVSDELAVNALLTPGILPDPFVRALLCDFADHALARIEDAHGVVFEELHAAIGAHRGAAWGLGDADRSVLDTPEVRGLLAWFETYTRARVQRTGPAHVYRAVASAVAVRAAEVTSRNNGVVDPKKYARALRTERGWQRAHLSAALACARDGVDHPPWRGAETALGGSRRAPS